MSERKWMKPEKQYCPKCGSVVYQSLHKRCDTSKLPAWYCSLLICDWRGNDPVVIDSTSGPSLSKLAKIQREWEARNIYRGPK